MADNSHDDDRTRPVASLAKGTMVSRYRIIEKIGSAGGIFLYDLSGRVISEFAIGGRWKADYIYLNGKPLAKIILNTAIIPRGPSFPQELVFYYHIDHLGTPLAMTGDDKKIVWSTEYYPYGDVYDETGSRTNEIRFPGQYHDRETDRYYNWHRYYDPVIGRYMQADPIGVLGGINQYSYVRNNPITYFDPWGLKTLPEYWKDIEEIMGPFVVAGGAVYVGSMLIYGGTLATGGLVMAIPETYGASAIGIPGTLAVTGGGVYLFTFGTNTYVHHLNNLFGLKLPTLTEWGPDYFPAYPIPHEKRKKCEK